MKFLDAQEVGKWFKSFLTMHFSRRYHDGMWPRDLF